MRPPTRHQGLTLIELLVTLSIMALIGVMSWRALDGMGRTQEQTQHHSDLWLNWQTALAQWQTDLDAVQDPKIAPPLEFNGRVLRLVRRASPAPDGQDPGLYVVAWTLLNDPASATLRWTRWRSASLVRQDELLRAWDEALQWGMASRVTDDPRQVWLTPASQWELFYHRGGSWSNPLSAGDSDTTNTRTLPDGIRLVITVPAQSPAAGRLTLDWVRPTQGGGKAS